MLNQDDCLDKTDEEIVKLTLVDQEFYYCLVVRYEEKLKRYIRRISSADDEEINDVLQNIFLKIYLNLNDFDQDLSFSSWVYRIAHNEVINSYRKIKARPAVALEEVGEFNLLLDELAVTEQIDRKILKEKISQVLALMEEKYREVLVLKFLEEKDYQEISDILKKPMGTVATLINRAKKQFIKISQQEKIVL